MTLFVDCLPLSTAMPIWDLLMHEGLPAALRVAIVILEHAADVLLDMQLTEMVQFFEGVKVG
eukprot:773283-Amphidinium_carterae.2